MSGKPAAKRNAKPSAKTSSKRRNPDVDSIEVPDQPHSPPAQDHLRPIFSLGDSAVASEDFRTEFAANMSLPDPVPMDVVEAVPVLPVLPVLTEAAVRLSGIVIPDKSVPVVPPRFLDWNKIRTSSPSTVFTTEEKNLMDLMDMVHENNMTIRTPLNSETIGRCMDRFDKDGVQLPNGQFWFVIARRDMAFLPEGFATEYDIRDTSCAFVTRPKKDENVKKGPDHAVTCFLGKKSSKVLMHCDPARIIFLPTGGEGDFDFRALEVGRKNVDLRKLMGSYKFGRDHVNMGAFDGTPAVKIMTPDGREFLYYLGHDAMILNWNKNLGSTRPPALVSVMHFAGEIMPASQAATPWGRVNEMRVARTSQLVFFTEEQWSTFIGTDHDALVDLCDDFTEVIKSLPVDAANRFTDLLFSAGALTTTVTFKDGTSQAEKDAVFGAGTVVFHSGAPSTKASVGRNETCSDNGGAPYHATVSLTAASGADAIRDAQDDRVYYTKAQINLWDQIQSAAKAKRAADSMAKRELSKAVLVEQQNKDVDDEEVKVFRGLIASFPGHDRISNLDLLCLAMLIGDDKRITETYDQMLSWASEDKQPGVHAGAALAVSTYLLKKSPAGKIPLLQGMIEKHGMNPDATIVNFPKNLVSLESLPMLITTAFRSAKDHRPAEGTHDELDTEFYPLALETLIKGVVARISGAPKWTAGLIPILEWCMLHTQLEKTKDVWREKFLNLALCVIHLTTRDDLDESRCNVVRQMTILRLGMTEDPIAALRALIPVVEPTPAKKARKPRAKAIKPAAPTDAQFDQN